MKIDMYNIIYVLMLLFFNLPEVKAQKEPESIHIKLIDKQKQPVFGVYIVQQKQNLLLTTSDIDGECVINKSTLQPTDSLRFQGIGYETTTHCLRDLKDSVIITLPELKYDLQEVQIQGISTEELLKIASSKLSKNKTRRIPLCYYYGPAQYEKITWCKDSAIEYRHEYGFYFYSGDIKPRNSWDATYRSYLFPEYMAKSYSLTVDGSDTLIPIYLTTEDTRFDVGTRKIFTLIRAVQLFAPLFNGTEYYEIKAMDSDSPDHVFSFKTKTTAYPNQVRISCKGSFTIDRERRELKSMDFDYIDYQLLRQVLLTNRRKTSSPFSTRASLTFAYDSSGQNYVRSCKQSTTWKYDLSPDFILIEQPSRIHPGINKLVEEEAFYCYKLKDIPTELQTNRTLVKIHLAQRYPQGIYNPDVFRKLTPLLDSRRARADLNRYMDLEKQFQRHNGRAFYPENYILHSLSDKQSLQLYHENLYDTRVSLFESFGHCPLPEEIE